MTGQPLGIDYIYLLVHFFRFAKFVKVRANFLITVCLSVRPNVTLRLPRVEFPYNIL
jgi:hypothetical protein